MHWFHFDKKQKFETIPRVLNRKFLCTLGKPSKKNSKHDFFPKRNYDKRVGARIISQIIKTMNDSLFIEKHYSKPTVITFIFIFLHMSSERYFFVLVFKEFKFY